MPNENLTEIVFILDKSGSMYDLRLETVEGFNNFIEEQKKMGGEANLTLVMFNHNYFRFDTKNLNDAEQLDTERYQPNGYTALLDAVGKTIDDVGVRLEKTEEHLRPKKVIIVIMTDGLENASSNYSKEMVASKIEHQRNVYNWEFIFLGANQDSFLTAEELNIAVNMTENWEHTSGGIRSGYTVASNKVSSVRNQ